MQALAAEEAAAAEEQRRAADEAARRLAIRADKAALVAPEPAAEDVSSPHSRLLFRLPDGSKLDRRFRLEQQVQELFDYLDSEVSCEGDFGWRCVGYSMRGRTAGDASGVCALVLAGGLHAKKMPLNTSAVVCNVMLRVTQTRCLSLAGAAGCWWFVARQLQAGAAVPPQSVGTY